LKKAIYFTNIFPHYRKLIWSLLLNEKKYSFEIFYSKKTTWGIESLNIENTKAHILKNYFIFNRIFWQTKVLRTLIFKKYDIVFFIGEMSILSTWVGAIICRVFRKKVIFWGHGLYGNENRIKKFFRILFLKLAHINLVYEKRAKKLLIEEGLKKNKIKVVYNSLDYDLQLRLFQNLEQKPKSKINYFNNNLPVVVFVGRLSKIKQIEILIKATEITNSKHPRINLLIVGDGPEKSKLEVLAKNRLINHNYKFLGAIYDENQLSKIFYHSKICISPGNIGLTGIHSLSYGTPVGSHNNFNYQMPEVEAIEYEVNGFLFKQGDVVDLSNSIINWINKSVKKSEVRKVIDLKYNPYIQKRVFDELIINND
tara:strand:- start:1695 stop:2798 length:1104 start_codon:yes stop_codon:yes gene_type:complete